MRILFVHHYFPGQFKRIAAHYVAAGHDVVAFYRGLEDGRASPPVAGVRMISYGEEVHADRPEDHILHDTENFIRESASVGFRAATLKEEGWIPDLVYDHSGWGTGAFLHDVFPNAGHIRYCEWFYNNSAESTEFLSGEGPFEHRFMNSLMNLPIMMDLVRADLMIAPTKWQRAQFPKAIRKAMQIAPDGVDTDLFRPDREARFTLENGRILAPGDRVITYVARGADPFRGFAPFMRALSDLQARDKDVEAVIVGDRKVYYGGGSGKDQHFHDVLSTVKLDPGRTHFTGVLAYDDYRKVLQVSAAHVYLTAPFVLSWSALEAMSTGCAIIGSDTAPVREFITHGQQGLLADFHDSRAIADAIETMLEGGSEVLRMRDAARQAMIEQWSAGRAVTCHLALVDAISRDKD
jgi:glycosyltransferase involved in cell wall biosynthesis